MTKLANKTIRDAAKRSGVRLWEVAYSMGITDATLSRKLRRELPADEQAQVLDIIARISSNQTEGN